MHRISSLLSAAIVVISALIVPPSAAADVCGECGQGKICKPHRASDKAAIQKLQPDLKSLDLEVRMQALREVADLSQDHDNAPSKEAAEVLAAALDDHKLKVQRTAIQLLSRGQHPETAVVAVVAKFKWYKGHMWTLVADMTGPKEEHGNVGEAMDLLQSSVAAAKELRDDRIVEALGSLLKAFPTEMRGEPVAMAASRALLYLGTREAVETVIKQFGSVKDASKMRQVHFALKTFANRLEVENTPEFSEKLERDWTTWMRKHQRKIPKKLGKWNGPPPEDDQD